MRLVRREVPPKKRQSTTKPTIALAIAETCTIEQIPKKIKEVFSWLRRCAGIEEEKISGASVLEEIDALIPLGFPATKQEQESDDSAA